MSTRWSYLRNVEYARQLDEQIAFKKKVVNGEMSEAEARYNKDILDKAAKYVN
jgi:hypothetical protein